MKTALIAAMMLLCMYFSHGQTKVFKEVSDDISSQIRTIRQDNVLVGYIVFTTLEKASADSFNYKITIMDENLNDIGTVNFRQEKLYLQAASFEQDVLCLAYLKTNFIGAEFKNKREHKAVFPKAKSSVFIQFLGLDGKIIQSNTVVADVQHNKDPYYPGYGNKYLGSGKLKHNIQLSNISGKGFACFYGDQSKNNLLVYNATGTLTWKKNIKEEADAFGLLTSLQNVYILCKMKDPMQEGGYELLGFGISDSSTFPKYTLKDKQGNSLKVISFDNDPATGKPYLSGYIINPRKGNKYTYVQQVKRGTYAGLFSINVSGPKKADITEVFTYWNDGSQSFISSKGRFTENKAVAWYTESFRDYQGNTYFTGSSYRTRANWGSIIGTVVTLPSVWIPLMIAQNGYSKNRELAPILLKQNPKGVITLENAVSGNKYKFTSKTALPYLAERKYYCLVNSETKTNYMIVDDKKDIFVYNVTQKKVVRTIPHKDGNAQINVYPAKEGHVMVSEYNKKEKYTRYSIEAL